MRMRTHIVTLLCAGALGTVLGVEAKSQDQTMLLDLRGKWRFEIGDDPARANPSFNDASWVDISVPSPWEDQGFPGYDGFAWYRKHFTADPQWEGKVLYLSMGKIDDADEVYVNGHFIGFYGLLPPNYATAYDVDRNYPLPHWCLNMHGDNVIAVRVYDNGLAGGIVQGKIGICAEKDPLLASQSLAGNWKLMKGDNAAWKDPEVNDAGWPVAAVPAFWETQGLKDYDGFGWYRFHFQPSNAFQDTRMILLMGKIDDIDETYLNGERIGRTGTFSTRPEWISVNNEYSELRAYTIPANCLKFGADNVIAVRVFDKVMQGGIYDGPVGLITRDDYVRWEKHHKHFFGKPWDLLKEMFR